MTLQELYEQLHDAVEDGYNDFDIGFIGCNSTGAYVAGVEIDSERGTIYLIEGF